MKHYQLNALAIMLLASTATAQVALVPRVTAKTLDCAKRTVFAARSPEAGQLRPGPLLAAGMQGKTFAIAPDAALRAFDRHLHPHGWRGNLEQLPAGPEREAVRRIASLYENNYVVAAQMAWGAARRANLSLPPELAKALGEAVAVATEPTDHDPDLVQIEQRTTAAVKAVAGLPDPLRAFATWTVRGYAFNDAVAIDTALTGFCMSSPSPAAVEQLVAAVDQAHLDGVTAAAAPANAAPIPQARGRR